MKQDIQCEYNVRYGSYFYPSETDWMEKSVRCVKMNQKPTWPIGEIYEKS